MAQPTIDWTAWEGSAARERQQRAIKHGGLVEY
jgi:hypothetical protein